MSNFSKQQLFQQKAPAIMLLSCYVLSATLCSGCGFFTGTMLGYSAHLKKYFTVLRFTLKLDAVSRVRFSEHLNQNLVTVGFHKILAWLTSRKHGFTYCGKRNGEHASLFMFSVFCLMGCVCLTDADMEDLLPHLLPL